MDDEESKGDERKRVLVVHEGQRPVDLALRPVDRLLGPMQTMFRHSVAGAVLLLVAAIVALILANSTLAEAFEKFLHTPCTVGFGTTVLTKSLQHWINDGLMGIFFFFVGLEIKREVIVGELSTLRKAALPAVAAVGGMAVPAFIYYLINRGQEGISGWGIPMATDIAFALGVLALLGKRVPAGLRVFLTALAIVDDIGAILVIALFYTQGLALWSLLAGGVLLGISLLANRLQVRSGVFYFIVGTFVWLAFLQSGVHATVASLLMAFTIPVRTRLNGEEFIENMGAHLARFLEQGELKSRTLHTHAQHQNLTDMAQTVERASAPLQKLETLLVTPVALLVLPIFALANAGVGFSSGGGEATISNITLGAFFGLAIGKPVGIMLFSWLAVKLKLSELAQGISFSHIWGAGLLAGIGFTMALFISVLAFESPAFVDEAKFGVLAASLLSGLSGFLWLRWKTGPIENSPEKA